MLPSRTTVSDALQFGNVSHRVAADDMFLHESPRCAYLDDLTQDRRPAIDPIRAFFAARGGKLPMNVYKTASRMMDRCALRVAAMLGAFVIAGCTKPHCENDVIRGVPSQDGANIAFIFRRSCGTPTGSSTNVSVIEMHHSLRSGPGNVLVVGDEQALHVAWLGPRRLLIAGFQEPISLLSPQVDLVTIEFRRAATE